MSMLDAIEGYESNGDLLRRILEQGRRRMKKARSVLVVEPGPPDACSFSEQYRPVPEDARYGLIEAHMAKLVLMVDGDRVRVLKSRLVEDVAPGEEWSL